MTPDEVYYLELEHQRKIDQEEQKYIDLYDTKGEYSHSEIQQPNGKPN